MSVFSVRQITLSLLVVGAIGPASAGAEVEEVRFPRGATAHLVADPGTPLEARMLGRLATYMERVLGAPAVVVTDPQRAPEDAPAVLLVSGRVPSPWSLSIPETDDECFAIRTGLHQGRALAVLAGHTDRGLKRAVQQLIFLSRQEPDALVIPSLDLSESPWIQSREWTICPWTPSYVRGVFHNPWADPRLDITRYHDQRLSDYVEMFDWLGYSGSQLMETCYTYAVFRSIEGAQAWQRRVAELLRENGQEVSLWAWTAQFNNHGWVDPDVTYTPAPGLSAFDDPDVRRAFEKYYDHYAELAPYIDRFFAHFFDPGELKNRQDVFQYMRLLESKLKARNPAIQMGIDGWASDPDYLNELARNGFSHYLLLEILFPELYPGEARIRLHEEARERGLALGIWGWYTTEYESDQMASMYVNAGMLRDIYQEIRSGAQTVHPVSYWSEMEAHHVNNLYSMYAAARLLWNPDRDPEALLAEITDAIWGPKNGPLVHDALSLIEDVRTGPSWDTYWWGRPTHRVGTEDPARDRDRADRVLAALDAMQPDAGYVPKLPLPWPPETLVELMRPHLLQIRAYAEFRLGVDELRAAAAGGAATDTLQAMLDQIWKPVPEYNTWIGVFDTKEVREQKKTVRQLAGEYGLVVNDPAWLRDLETDRVLQQLRTWQQTSREPYTFDSMTPTREFFWPEDNRRDRFNQLVERGLVIPAGGDRFQLADWENWRLQT